MTLVTGLTRAREQAVQQRLFAASANRIERALRSEISRAMGAMASEYDSPGALAGVEAEHRERMEKILNRGWRSVFDTFGKRILDGAQKCQRGMERKGLFDEFEPLIQNWIRRFGAQKVTEIVGTTHKQAMAVINQITAEAARDGLGQAATGRAIRSAMRERAGVLSVARSRVIARTETHAASQAANQAAAKATGLSMRKVWLAAAGERTREDHADADGQQRRLDEPFIVGGEELMQPGDPAGSAEQVISCRCAVGYEVE